MKDGDVRTWFGELRPGEQVVIGGGIRLRIEEKSGQRARLRIDLTEPTTVEKVQPGAAAIASRGLLKTT